MTILHHPSELLITAYATGNLDLGRHIALSTHMMACAKCRNLVEGIERVGGAFLDSLPPTAMPLDAIDKIQSRLNLTDGKTISKPALHSTALDGLPGIPNFVRQYKVGEWTWVAPRLHKQPIHIPDTDDARVFLLKAGPGLKLLQHTHTETEMTCILQGHFSHSGQHFGIGDFDLGDPDIDHEITIGSDQDCICLVAMRGQLRLKGLLGKIMQPFVAI